MYGLGQTIPVSGVGRVIGEKQPEYAAAIAPVSQPTMSEVQKQLGALIDRLAGLDGLSSAVADGVAGSSETANGTGEASSPRPNGIVSMLEEALSAAHRRVSSIEFNLQRAGRALS